MRVEGIAAVGFPVNIKIYAIPKYTHLEKTPPVMPVERNFLPFSKEIQKFDLFRYYLQNGIQKSYEKGQIVDFDI